MIKKETSKNTKETKLILFFIFIVNELFFRARQTIGFLPAEHLQDSEPSMDLYRHAAENQRPAGL